jgi:hypothetical protein
LFVVWKKLGGDVRAGSGISWMKICKKTRNQKCFQAEVGDSTMAPVSVEERYPAQTTIPDMEENFPCSLWDVYFCGMFTTNGYLSDPDWSNILIHIRSSSK